MKLLLDTCVVIWALTEPERISRRVMSTLSGDDVMVMVSAVSAWEMAVKQSLGKLTLPGLAEEWLPAAIDAFGASWTPITPRQALIVGRLPYVHRDPFDRLLVAQAIDLGVTLASSDGRLAPYGIPVLWK